MKISTKMLKTMALLVMGASSLGASANANFTADPIPDSKVSELSQVTLTFPDATIVDMGSQYRNVTITKPEFTRNCTLEYGSENNQIVVSFTTITEEGTYTLNVPEDAITADEEPVESFTITYEVGTEVISNATLIPAPGEVTWLYEFTFCDPTVTSNLNVDSYGDNQPTLTSPSGDVSEIYSVYDYQIGAGKYRFRLRQLANEPGIYTINIPDNYISYTDESYNRVYLPACEFSYEVTGGTLTQVVSDPSMTNPTTNFNYLNLEFPGYSTVSIKEGLSYTDKSIPVYRDGTSTSVSTIMLEAGPYNFSIDGNTMSYVNNYQDCITPGHYVMTIPEGYILLGEEQTPCTPLVIEFEVVEPEPTVIEISPANGSTVSMLNCATISFPELAQVDLGRYPSMKMEKVTLQDGVENLITIGGAYGMSSFERLSDNSFRAIFNGLATADGTYRLTLNSNSFVFESGFNLETTVDVQFTAPEAPAYEMTPDNSEALPKLQKFTITFPEESVVYVNTLLSNNTSTLYKGEEIIRDGYGYITNPLVGSTGFYSPVEGTTNSFSFTLGSAGLDEGKYVLMIPAGVFLMGEDENNFNQGISIVYECNGEGLDKLEVTPSIPVRELTSMEITYVNETSISFQSSYPGFSFYKYVEGQTYGTWVEYMGSDNVRIEGNTLYLTLSNPVTEEGVYYIEISNYSLYLSDGETTSTPQKVYFTVDPNAEPVSVESIASEQTDNRIYTITGIEVKEMTAPGLYIVNGKKIVVR